MPAWINSKHLFNGHYIIIMFKLCYGRHSSENKNLYAPYDDRMMYINS